MVCVKFDMIVLIFINMCANCKICKEMNPNF